MYNILRVKEGMELCSLLTEIQISGTKVMDGNMKTPSEWHCFLAMFLF